MEELTQLIKKNIKLKYSSTKRFAQEIGIPQTTIVSALKNGISGTSFSTVCKMCQALDIKLINGIYPVAVSDTTTNLIKKMSQLDEKGIHTVTTVMEMEYMRCMAETENFDSSQKNVVSQPIKAGKLTLSDEFPTKNDVTKLFIAINDNQ